MIELTRMNSAEMFPREWGATCASAKKPILFTRGILFCLMTTFYHEGTGVAALGHVTPITDPKSLLPMIEIFTKMNIPAAEIRCKLVGGVKDSSSVSLVDNVKYVLLSNGINTIDESGLYHKIYPSNELISKLSMNPTSVSPEDLQPSSWARGGIDARNGNVFFDDLPVHFPSELRPSHEGNLHLVRYCDYTLEPIESKIHEAIKAGSESKRLQKSLKKKKFSLMLRQCASSSSHKRNDLLMLLIQNRVLLRIDIEARGDKSGHHALDKARLHNNQKAIDRLAPLYEKK